MKNHKVAVGGTVSFLFCFLLFCLVRPAGTTTKSNPQSPPNPSAAAPSTDVPEHIFYGQVFSLLSKLKNKDDYRREARLTEAETSLLEQIAADCERETAAIDASAETVIKAFRQQLGTKLEKRPQPVPAELIKLQAKRDAVILRNRDQLRKVLGEGAFSRFTTAGRSIVHITVTSVK
ncbi:MAG TPA: hypothetical protein VMZ30_01160 [Pyrinomonadaceae bacterium]|nr:hypothetical protein [Pyrinomonadaceae bacterium]